MLVDHQRYKLGEEIGHGGMGVIYQAHDTLLDRDVAVKVLSGNITEEGRRRLLHEAKTAARLNHPNIVSIFDAGETQGHPYVVMELVEGESLFSHRPENQEQLIALALQICAALEHAHSNGIIHRDLKPENIILTPQGKIKLLDFGLARSIASRVSSQGAIVGTVFYLAPEMALGKEVDNRADLYSLGVILYELLTGQLPFDGDDPLTVISQHLYAPVVPPSTLRAEVLPIEPIILKLLAKKPEERFASAHEVAGEFQKLLTQKEQESSRAEHSELLAEIPLPPIATGGALLEQLARGRMIGRRSELKRLRQIWARTQQGQGHMALISGEPGIGKTRICKEMIVSAQMAGAVIMHGGCYEYEAATPYLPFVEALREWVHLQSPEKIRSILNGNASELTRLAPEIESKLGPLPANPPLPPNEERLRLFDNVSRFFNQIAEEHGLLLFIDDLHWADQGTLSLLFYILRDLRNKRVMILAAYREIELDRTHPLAGALVEWNRDHLATRIPLERLSFDDTSAHLAMMFGQETISLDFARAMYAETEGNPFFLEEVVKALIEQGQIYRENNNWERKDVSELTIPQSVKEAIGRRLNRLSKNCADMLHTAAALGKNFKFSELAAASPMSEEFLLDTLDEASSAQLLHAEGQDSFVFSHDKIREVLYEELNPIRRKRMHQRIGEGLEKMYAADIQNHVQELSHHFTESGDLPRSLRYSLQAADQARRLFASDDALRYYDQAREAAEALDQTGELASIHSAIAEVYSIRGPVNKTIENFDLAISLTHDPQARGAIKARVGTEYASVGDARGIDYINQALQELDSETQSNEVALATAMLGRYYHYRAIHSKAIEYLEKARALAEPSQDPSTLSLIYSYLAGAHQHLTQYKESMDWARKCIELGERAQTPLAAAFGYEFLAEDTMAMGDWRDAIQYAERDREIGEKIEAKDRLTWAAYCRSFAEFVGGDLTAAEEDSRISRQLADEIGDTRVAIMANGLRVQVLADLGRDEEASILAEQILHESDQIQHVTIQALALHCVAYWRIGQGEYQTALSHYWRAEKLISATENVWMPMMYRPYMGQVLVELGYIDEAASLLTATLTVSLKADSRYCAAQALRAMSRVYSAQGKLEDAFDMVNQSITLLSTLDCRLELGRSLTQRGRLYKSQGDDLAATNDWQRALDLFHQIGAAADYFSM
jgi:tetratricopeptide (TPR) repeat protein/predicted Ser/Thr protein kinase